MRFFFLFMFFYLPSNSFSSEKYIFQNDPSFLKDESSEYIKTGFFKQKENHFSVSSTSTFNQKYIVYAPKDANKHSPVFYMLGNESAINDYYLRMTAMKLWADTFNGISIVLEHRMYGESLLKGGLTPKNLKKVTTLQILEDYSRFQNGFKSKNKLTGPWIVVGSSYAGNLSAYYHLKYPHLTKAAIVSSAPLKTQPFNTVMDDFVAESQTPKCLSSLKNHLNKLENDTLHDLQKRIAFLNAIGGEKLTDDADILVTISDIFTVATQRGLNISFCKEIEKNFETQSLVNALKLYLGTDTLYSQSLNYAKDKYSNELTKSPSRTWYYQACREYGFFQLPSLNEMNRFRSLKINKDYYKKFCRDTYGVELNETPNKILTAFLNKMKINANKSFFILNGLADPWSTLSLIKDEDSPESTIHNFSELRHGVGISGSTLVDPHASKNATLKRESQDIVLEEIQSILQR